MDAKASHIGLAYLASRGEWAWSVEPNLSRVLRVASELGNPQNNVATVHVAGTNGKGSVCAAVARIFAEAGLLVGLTTSPHLLVVNERITIGGCSLSDEELDGAISTVVGAAQKVAVELSFFEIITLAAFWVFNERRVSLAVVEVGLGGRLDATNIIRSPRCTAITSIGLDHEAILGGNVSAIAKEKAGILKSGCPFVLGRCTSEVSQLLLKESEVIGVSVKIFGADYGASSVMADGSFVYWDKLGREFLLKPSLKGIHQVYNMALATRVALECGASVESCVAGISSVLWPGRLEVGAFARRRIYFDAAHNIDGIRVLVDSLAAMGNSTFDLVFGALDTKRWHEMVNMLKPYVNKWFLVSPDSPRAVESSQIASYLSGLGVSGDVYIESFSSLSSRLESFSELSDLSQCPIVVAGSIYMMGKVRKVLGAK